MESITCFIVTGLNLGDKVRTSCKSLTGFKSKSYFIVVITNILLIITTQTMEVKHRGRRWYWSSSLHTPRECYTSQE